MFRRFFRLPTIGPQTPTLKWRFQATNHGFAALMYAPAIGISGTVYVGTNVGFDENSKPLRGRYRLPAGAFILQLD
jgi:hypothetical protein